MESATLDIMLLMLVVGVFGAVIGWISHSAKSRRALEQLDDEWQLKFDELLRQRDRRSVENDALRKSIDTQQVILARHEHVAKQSRTELESERERTKTVSKNLFAIGAERDDFKDKASRNQDAFISVKQQAVDLQDEFAKTGRFFQGELTKSFDKRKVLETKVENAKLERESLDNLLNASRSEHASANIMLESAQSRLDNIDVLEENVIRLEADNAQLRHDSAGSKQEIEALARDVAELDELKVQNKELAHCLKSMEGSRKQYEDDAKRYRDNAGQSEQESETLRVKLDEIEKNFASLEKRKDDAVKEARQAAARPKANGHAVVPVEKDDLKQIVGIGKVFEHTLHELGVFNYRQIAAFGVSDIARVNMALKEFKGRMEQDDWVGQAKELHFQKYGKTG